MTQCPAGDRLTLQMPLSQMPIPQDTNPVAVDCDGDGPAANPKKSGGANPKNPFHWLNNERRDDLDAENRRPANPVPKLLGSTAADDAADAIVAGSDDPGAPARPDKVQKTGPAPAPVVVARASAHGGSTYGSVVDAADEDEATYWRKMFHALHRERVTAAEAQLKCVAEEGERRLRALRNYVRHLEVELEAARKVATATAPTPAPAPASASAAVSAPVSAVESERKDGGGAKAPESEINEGKDVAELREAVRLQKRTIGLYRTLTGTTISDVTSSSFDCTVVNRETRKASKFRLTNVVNDEKKDGVAEDEMMRFEPLAHAEHLPDFLRNTIEFETTQCPALMENVLRSMFPED